MLQVTAVPPPLLQEGASITMRLQQLKGPLATHFTRMQKLDRYSRRVPTSWFPSATVSAPSVMLSTIRSVEKTAIAYLAGGKPAWRVASYGGYGGMAQQDEARAARDSRFERLARAIFHHIDRQSEINLLYEPVERAVRQGEIIFQFGWLNEAERRVQDPMMPEMQGSMAFALHDDLGEEQDEGPGDVSAEELGEEAQREDPPRFRFPIYIKVHDRMRVYYELDPYGEPLEVYHDYASRASQVAEEYPDWEDAKDYDPSDLVHVVQAWVGGWTAVMVGEKLLAPARQHRYGSRPPFVIERCAPENVADRALDFGVAEVRAGIPFAMDMIEAYEQACVAASLKRSLLESAALGAFVLENASPQRFTMTADGVEVALDIKLGPGTVLTLYKDEKLTAAPVATLPPALASFLETAGEDMAILSFSPKLLMGDSQGDPSGYGIEQVRQAAMARLMPYRDALGRSFSRLFEKIFGILATNWAAEWGDSLAVAGQHNGKFFQEVIRPEDLSPAPDHVEMTLTPNVPQNKIAEQQAIIALVQAHLKDPIEALEELNAPEPQESWDSILLHMEQVENPMVRGMAVQGIIAERARRAGVPLPPAPGTTDIPEGLGVVPPLGPAGPGGPPPGAGGPPPGGPPGLAGGPPLGAGPGMAPGARPNMDNGMQAPPLPPAARQGARGPAPQQRPGLRPLGVPGAPNMPVPNIRTRKAA